MIKCVAEEMVTPTPEEILEIFEGLNFPSATKLRAALLKKGFKARIKDVEQFVKSQTPTQLFAKAPKYRGKIIASRPNERWVLDFIDFPRNQVANSSIYCSSRTCPTESCGQRHRRRKSWLVSYRS